MDVKPHRPKLGAALLAGVLLLVAAPAYAAPGAAQPTTDPAVPVDDCPKSPDPPIGVPFASLDDQHRVVIGTTPVDNTGGDGKINLVLVDRSDRSIPFH